MNWEQNNEDTNEWSTRVLPLEGFLIECRETKTKVITTANQNSGKYQKEPMRTQSKRM